MAYLWQLDFIIEYLEMNLHLALLADIKNQLKVIQNIIVYHIVEIFSLRVLKVKLLSLIGNIVKLAPNFLFFASKIVPEMEILAG
jgi:hypothetical protein